MIAAVQHEMASLTYGRPGMSSTSKVEPTVATPGLAPSAPRPDDPEHPAPAAAAAGELAAAFNELSAAAAATGRARPRIGVALDTGGEAATQLRWVCAAAAATTFAAARGCDVDAFAAVGAQLSDGRDLDTTTAWLESGPAQGEPGAVPFTLTLANPARRLTDGLAIGRPAPTMLVAVSGRRPAEDSQRAMRLSLRAVLDQTAGESRNPNPGGYVLWAYAPSTPLMRMPIRVHLHALDPTAGPDGDLLSAYAEAAAEYAERIRTAD